MVDTVKTVKPSGGDYTSLSAWEAGQQKVIASGDSEQAECYAMSDTTAVTITGWTTAADAYIRIYTPTSERHDGKWNTGKYLLSAATTPLAVTEENVRIEGLQIHMTSTTTAQIGVNVNTTGVLDVRIENCLVRANDAIANNCTGVSLFNGAAGSVVRIKNTAIYGWYSAGNFDSCVRLNNANVTVHMHNCVIARGNYGVRCQAGTVNAKNCYAGATDHGDYLAEGTGVINRTTAASEDTTGSAGLQNIAYSISAGAYFTNITAGSEDFHIGASSALKDVGTDLSADANYAFTDDIDGQTRSAPWDIGADEIVAAAAATTTKRRPRHTIYPVPGPYNLGQFLRRRGSTSLRATPVSVGQVTETDVAQAITSRKTKALGQIAEVDTAQSLTARKTAAVGQVTETDAAQGVTRVKRRAVGQITETDVAQAVTSRKTKTVGQATEADLAQAISASGNKIIAVGQASETETAQALTRLKRKALGQCVEVDLSQNVSAAKRKALGQVAESDTALGATVVKRLAIAQVMETDSAIAINRLKVTTLGQATETDLAQALVTVTPITPNTRTVYLYVDDRTINVPLENRTIRMQ